MTLFPRVSHVASSARPRRWLLGFVAAAALLSAAPGVSAQDTTEDDIQAEIDRLLGEDGGNDAAPQDVPEEWSREQICGLRVFPLRDYLATLEDRSVQLIGTIGEWDVQVSDLIAEAESAECSEAVDRIEAAEQEGTRLRSDVQRLTTQLTHVRDCARQDYRDLLDQWLELTDRPEEEGPPADDAAPDAEGDAAGGEAAPEAGRRSGNVATDLFLYDAAVMFRHVSFDANLVISELTQDVDTRLGALLQSMDDVRRRCEFLGG